MLLGWPDVELTAVTTTIDPDGLRAGCAAHVLALAGRLDVPVAAGARVSMTTGERADPDPALWPRSVRPRPSPPGAAVELLAASAARGAAIVATGPQTNLAELALARPGALAGVPVVVMGGWTRPAAAGLPPWGPELDWNVQWDARAAAAVATSGARLTLVTLPATLAGHLRRADVPRLRASGPLGVLLADQGEAWAERAGMPGLAAAHPGLPDDLLNFHYDPAAAAVAAGWAGAVVQEERLTPRIDAHGVLRWIRDPAGAPVRVVTGLDGPAFGEAWLAAVEAAQADASSRSKARR